MITAQGLRISVPFKYKTEKNIHASFYTRFNFRFGSPHTMLLCRLTCYQDIQKLILKEMNTMLHDEILTTDQDIPLFRIKIVDGVTMEVIF